LPSDLVVFCESEYPRLVAALSLYCGDREVAKELAHEAIARLIRDWRKVRRLEWPQAWLHRVALNLANSMFRRRAAERRVSLRLPSLDRTHHHDHPQDQDVRRAVAGLPPRQRTALVLRYFLDLSVAQVADLMQCSEGTVRALTHQAIASLRKRPELMSLKEVSDGP